MKLYIWHNGQVGEEEYAWMSDDYFIIDIFMVSTSAAKRLVWAHFAFTRKDGTQATEQAESVWSQVDEYYEEGN